MICLSFFNFSKISNFLLGCFSVRHFFSSLSISFNIFAFSSSSIICSVSVLPSSTSICPILFTFQLNSQHIKLLNLAPLCYCRNSIRINHSNNINTSNVSIETLTLRGLQVKLRKNTLLWKLLLYYRCLRQSVHVISLSHKFINNSRWKLKNINIIFKKNRKNKKNVSFSHILMIIN